MSLNSTETSEAIDDFDKVLNRQNGFKYFAADDFDAKKHVRFLVLHSGNDQIFNYDLKTVPLDQLHDTYYRALSYTWGRASSLDSLREIRVNDQIFFIRQNLFDFLMTAFAKGEHGLIFIDAISINQNDHDERGSAVQEMARIFRNANQVIAWLGYPETTELKNIRALHAGCHDGDHSSEWSTSQWDGFRYLSYNRYWSRVWIVQEVLLASDMRPTNVESAISLRNPAGTKLDTIDEMRQELQRPYTLTKTFQSQTPDLLHQVLRKFGRLESSDARDKLYGFLGILDGQTQTRIVPDYTRGLDYAYYQALKIGLWELYRDRGVISYSKQFTGKGYIRYYCDARDAFGIADRESIPILRQVIAKLRFRTRFEDAILKVQWK
ncbi:MAG: hypothetical protein Q9227_008958 [Pyrenula ochraceoflavens]